jgi:hypothetical protein
MLLAALSGTRGSTALGDYGVRHAVGETCGANAESSIQRSLPIFGGNDRNCKVALNCLAGLSIELGHPVNMGGCRSHYSQR